MSSSGGGTVGGLAAALAERFPLEWAESWDNVGLIAGEAAAPLAGVFVTLDATAEAVVRAVTSGANVLVTHHPAFLEAPERVTPSAGPEGALEAALRSGVALFHAHTNLDRAPAGADALSRALGLTIAGPLESTPEEIVVVTTFAPPETTDALRAAMSAAGAGRLGEYEACAFAAHGTGYFDARATARPVSSGGAEGVTEVRLEMVVPPSRVGAVLDAARGAHPYEEPLIVATPGRRARGAARLGRVCSWDGGATLGELASHVGRALGVTCRVWGDANHTVERIAVANGSAGSLIGDALRSADTLIAGEVRYHDALAAVASGFCIVEAGHDATEWPLVRVLADAVRDAVSGTATVTEEQPTVGWWTTKESHVER